MGDDSDKAHIFAGVQIQSEQDKDLLIGSLTEDDYPVVDLTDNEMAKLHLRHMVGGRCQDVADEVVYRFRFPESPGALMTFLQTLGDQWNISLFHYRNHGADFGRVLCGLQVPSQDNPRFQKVLDEIGYIYHEETDNPAYQLFLS